VELNLFFCYFDIFEFIVIDSLFEWMCYQTVSIMHLIESDDSDHDIAQIAVY